MLTKFAVRNYRGFAERIEFDLSKPNNYEYNDFAVSNGIVKNGIIYGPNGSGKTNFGLAIFDIEYHLAPLKAKKPDYYNNYVFGNLDTLVEFEYTFNFSGRILSYQYTKDKNSRIHDEALSVDGEFVFSRKENVFEINTKYFPEEKAIQENLKQNANNVSIVNFLLTFYPLSEDSFLIALQRFVNGMLWFKCLETREFIGIETQPNSNIEEYMIKNGLIDDFAAFVENVSGQKFDFIPPNADDKMLYYAVKGNRLSFIETVSTGTKSLELLYFWTKRMGDSSFVFIDEFDAFYHFRLAFNVCKSLFGLPCQLFLSSHNTYLMTNELLRPDCNFILTDNKIKPLSDCTDKELRFGHNIEKLYRGKAFNV